MTVFNCITVLSFRCLFPKCDLIMWGITFHLFILDISGSSFSVSLLAIFFPPSFCRYEYFIVFSRDYYITWIIGLAEMFVCVIKCELINPFHWNYLALLVI